MIDRQQCWRARCAEDAEYITVDRVGVPLCLRHAAQVAGEVRLTPLIARYAYSRLVRRDLPRSPGR
jgi:hypothetical protein